MNPQSSSSDLPRHISDAISEHFERIRSQTQFAPDANSTHSVGFPQTRDATCVLASNAFRSSLVDWIDALHSDLRFRVDVRAQVNRLPEDILVHIFSGLPIPLLIVATHVCHRWRKLGLSTPSLWTQLDVTDADAAFSSAAVILERSKASAVDIVLSLCPNRSPGRDYNGLASLIESHLSHVRSLSIPSPPRARIVIESNYNHIFQVKPASLRPPGPAAPIPAPRLERLRIDAKSAVSQAFSLDERRADGRPSFTCPALRELNLAECFPTLEFLDDCSQLRVLELHIPRAVCGRDVLRLLRRNPSLHTVKLWIPFQWSGRELLCSDVAADDIDDGKPLICDVQHFSVGGYHTGNRPPTETAPSLFQAARFFTSRVGAWRIPSLAVLTPSIVVVDSDGPGANSDSERDILSHELLAHLDGVSAVELSQSRSQTQARADTRDIMLLSLADARGFVRTLSPRARTRPLEMARPFLVTCVRVLRVGLRTWVALAAQHPDITELPSLEELELRGPLAKFASMPRGGAACPRLQRLSLVIRTGLGVPQSQFQSQSQSQSQWDTAHSKAVDDLISTGKAVALDRIRRCPQPLPVLTIVCEADKHFELEGRIVRCHPPEPESVNLTWVRAGEPSPEDL